MIVMSILNEVQQFHRKIYEVGYVSNKNSGKVINVKITKKAVKRGDFISPEFLNIPVISGSIKLSYEALIPFLVLSGHETRLLLFIIAYCANSNDNTFRWTHLIADEYIELYKKVTKKTVQPETVRQVLVKLNKLKYINKISKGNYMLNPLYSANGNKYEKAKLFNVFNEKEIKSGKTVTVDMLFKKP